MTPLEALLAILRDEGVTHIFGNPGTSELPFLDALVDASDMEYVLGVHEGPLVAMADGYARATRRPAFVNLHIAAGTVNGMIGLLNARRSRTPMVVMAGQQDRRHLLSDPMLSGDLVALAAAAVKRTYDLQHAHDLPVVFRRAFAAAIRPPAGPVFVSVPMDLLAETTTVDVPPRICTPSLGVASDLTAAVRLLGESRAPALIAGDDVGRTGAVADAVRLAEALGAEVWHQPMHDGIDFPMSHALHRGSLPPVAAEIRAALAPYDLVLLVGTHAFAAHHYSAGPFIDPRIPVIQIDRDAEELGRNVPLAVGLLGDPRQTMGALTKAIGERTAGAEERFARIAARTRAARAEVEELARGSAQQAPMDPLAACAAVVAALPPDCVVVEEAITSGVQLRRLLRLDRPDSLRHSVGGGLGGGTGMAVGTALADPERPVVAVLGDGCTLFGLQGLWSAARYDVPVTFVVMNNGEYRTLKDTLDQWHSRASMAGSYPGLDLAEPPMDFTTAAAFFGFEAARARTPAEVTELVERAVATRRPFLIDVPIRGHRDAV